MSRIHLNGWCNHYNGAVNKLCCVGISYDRFRGNPHEKWPCFQKGDTLPCESAVYPTPEEIAAKKVELDRHLEDIGAARAAIVAACGGPWKKGAPSKSGVIDCPVCQGKGTLGYSRAGLNGHVHAKCATTGCVCWME